VKRPGLAACATTLLAACLALPLAGCSKEEDPALPAACRGGVEAVLSALESAPGEVRLGDQTLADCMADAEDAGDVQELGAAYVEAARRLAERVDAQPRSAAAVQLGYLLGAARNGIERSVGIHEEMVRRIELELVPVETATEDFRRGERAGRAKG
jgi:hypothetical protein